MVYSFNVRVSHSNNMKVSNVWRKEVTEFWAT